MLYQTCAHVDLTAIEDNLRAVAERVGPQRRILMAIKADAYGHGAGPVGCFVQEKGLAHAFGVATVPEGIALREAGITLPILKLSGVFAEEADAAIAHDLTLTVPNQSTAVLLQAAAARAERRVVVHVKVDTGMRRIGCSPQEAPHVAAFIDTQCPDLNLEGLFTHLPVSDTPSEDAFTAHQLEVFAACRESVQTAIGRELVAHAANSGGVLAHPDSWLDMVRPGIMLYGSYPDPDVPHTVPLRSPLTWTSRVSFVKDVDAGESVGYGRTWVAPRRTRIATVPVGYGDGYDRHLSNRGEVLLAGRRLPIVGRVCMDQLMVDAGPDGHVHVGDRVVLLGKDEGEQISAADMAATLDTIPYEITCRLAARVTRTYAAGPT